MQNNQKVLMLGGGTSSSMLLRLMASSTLVPVDDVILSEFAVNDVEAALALSFITNEYRTGNSETTFADAFTGTSPKLTYSTAAGSNSTMTNSSGEIVWAPHNLIRYSEDLSESTWPSSRLVDPAQQSTTVLAPDGSGYAYYIEEDGTTGSRYIYDEFGPLSNATWTASVYIKQKDAGVYVQLRPRGVGSGLAFATFSPADGTLYESGGTELVSAVDGVAVGDGWFKVSMTCTVNLPAASDGLEFTVTDGSSGERPSYTGVGNGVYLWGAHVYRSDLGGMAQVPGADTGFETYVPTNGSAEYLPRVGHHVYNGSAWMNEGLLIESEARTNLVTYSEDFSDASWPKNNVSVAASAVADPAGGAGAYELVEDGATANHLLNGAGLVGVTSSTHTTSIFAKANTRSWIRVQNQYPANSWVNVDLSTGEYGLRGGGEDSVSLEPYGDGWYRISVTATTGSTVNGPQIFVLDSDRGGVSPSYTGDGTSSILIYGAQFEVGSTPSSYMPTSGGTYTRTAQSLTVPPAEFGWPEPEYIGPELIVDGSGNWVGDFDVAADLNSWAKLGDAATTITYDSGSCLINAATSYDGVSQSVSGLTVGKIYALTADCTLGTSSACHIRAGTFPTVQQSGGGTLQSVFVADAASIVIQAGSGNSSGTLNVDNISVREINPLSVSIQMDGRMTYADTGAFPEVRFFRWDADTSNFIDAFMGTNLGTGQYRARQSNAGTLDQSIQGTTNYYTPGVLVPFNISSRHGSTFVNGAVDGVALTEDTTPTALPDLSGTDLQIAKDFMGTIGTFRQFAGDIGDTGLVTATNPSTEPTLSLTFDGSEGSFYNLNWSE